MVRVALPRAMNGPPTAWCRRAATVTSGSVRYGIAQSFLRASGNTAGEHPRNTEIASVRHENEKRYKE